MRNDEEEIVGDKLRNAILIIWLVNKYDKNISTSKLSKLIGYDSSGVYSAIESGWFKQGRDGKLLLTEKSELYLQKKLLIYHSFTRRVLLYITIFPAMNLFQWFCLTYFNICLISDPYILLTSIILLAFLAINWYRILWWSLKRRKRL